jgi:RsiW-degrading membrane proteinase PrsW (M82 family)
MIDRGEPTSEVIRKARDVRFALCVVIIPMAIFCMMGLFFGSCTALGHSIWLVIVLGLFGGFVLVFVVFCVYHVIVIPKYLR